MSQKYIYGNTGVGTNITKLGAGAMPDVTGVDNTAFGANAANTITTGVRNTAIGSTTLENIISGDDNTAVGYNALNSITSNSQATAIGSGALQVFTNVSSPVAVGYNALSAYNGGLGSTAVGTQALEAVTSGAENTAIGHQALQTVSIGSHNTAVGNQTLTNLSFGNRNTGIGYQALRDNTFGNDNTAVGNTALFTATGFRNTACGHSALASVTTNDNVAVGDNALNLSSTGCFNVAVGSAALAVNSTGGSHTCVGYQSGLGNGSGANCVYVGFNAGSSLSTASNSVVIGHSATADSFCTVVGSGASSTSGATSAVSIGVNALSNIDSIAVGGSSNSTGNGSVAIGSGSNATGPRAIAIGQDASAAATDSCVILTGVGATMGILSFNGNTLWDGSFVGGFRDVQVNPAGDFIVAALPSDQRIKENVKTIDINNQLDLIMKLRPVSYEYSGRFKQEIGDGERVGLIAQELQEVMPELVVASNIYLNNQKMQDWADGVPNYTEESYEDPTGAIRTRHIPKQYEQPSDPILTIDFKAMVPRLLAGLQSVTTTALKTADQSNNHDEAISRLESSSECNAQQITILHDQYAQFSEVSEQVTNNQQQLESHENLLRACGDTLNLQGTQVNTNTSTITKHYTEIRNRLDEHQDTLDFYIYGEFDDTHDFTGAKSANKSNMLKLLMQTRPVEYQPGNNHTYVGKGSRVGLVTSELQKTAPEYVLEFDVDEPIQRPDYAAMVPILIAAIQEQQKQIEKLTDRVSVLERSTREKIKHTAPATREKVIRTRN